MLPAKTGSDGSAPFTPQEEPAMSLQGRSRPRSKRQRRQERRRDSKVVASVKVTPEYNGRHYAVGTTFKDVFVYGAGDNQSGSLIRTNVGKDTLLGSDIELIQKGYSNRAINLRRQRAEEKTEDPLADLVARYQSDEDARRMGASKLISLLRKNGKPFSNGQHRASLYALQFIQAAESRPMTMKRALRELPEEKGEEIRYGIGCPLR